MSVDLANEQACCTLAASELGHDHVL